MPHTDVSLLPGRPNLMLLHVWTEHVYTEHICLEGPQRQSLHEGLVHDPILRKNKKGEGCGED